MIVKVFRKIKTFRDDKGDLVELPLPAIQSAEAAAVDLQSPVPVSIGPGQRVVVDTGLICRAPRNHCFLVLSRSGLAAKTGVIVLNAPGLIDRDYSGPEDTIKVILHNTSDVQHDLPAGSRIAQLMLNPFSSIEWSEQSSADFVGTFNRGGLGSTGGFLPTSGNP